MEIANDGLEKLAEKLRAECRQFKLRASGQESEEDWVVKQLPSLLRQPAADLWSEVTRDRIDAMRRSQKRWARRGHPAYDLNRHITLERIGRFLAIGARSEHRK